MKKQIKYDTNMEVEKNLKDLGLEVLESSVDTMLDEMGASSAPVFSCSSIFKI
ncbi:hypothetical protein [Streptococcus acidominimus]|uniref:Uncharacterized protein n=1 Tax=Streptococcus acidominimus TaxID=1326 RepID=A0A380IGE3_STRAI|nr:hypothetical protein [Streptococcus acidominimus]SUN06812.1 Uncharacterised protein [Streptococcus acidominimus]